MREDLPEDWMKLWEGENNQPEDWKELESIGREGTMGMEGEEVDRLAEESWRERVAPMTRKRDGVHQLRLRWRASGEDHLDRLRLEGAGANGKPRRRVAST